MTIVFQSTPKLMCYHSNVTVSYIVLPEGSEVTYIQQRILPLVFMQYYDGVTESFHNIILIDGERPYFFAILR